MTNESLACKMALVIFCACAASFALMRSLLSQTVFPADQHSEILTETNQISAFLSKTLFPGLVLPISLFLDK